MFKTIESEIQPGWYGITDDHDAILYNEETFDSKKEAQKFADAHNNGARSYAEAYAMIYGIEIEHTGTPETCSHPDCISLFRKK
jgi:hypothetical protein